VIIVNPAFPLINLWVSSWIIDFGVPASCFPFGIKWFCSFSHPYTPFISLISQNCRI
jgi:hypothetical protein